MEFTDVIVRIRRTGAQLVMEALEGLAEGTPLGRLAVWLSEDEEVKASTPRGGALAHSEFTLPEGALRFLSDATGPEPFEAGGGVLSIEQ